jgi:putative membrane protein
MCGFAAVTPLGAATALIATVLIVAGVAGILAHAVRASRATHPPALPVAGWTPIETLKERYARGEIDHDELDRRLDRLLRRFPSG